MRKKPRVGVEKEGNDQNSVRVGSGLHFEKKLMSLAGEKASEL